jgi:hypothetical protein
MNRRKAVLLCLSTLLGGCSSWDVLSRSQSPDKDESPEKKTQLTGDLAVPFGLYPVRIEAVGLVTGLHHTGSDPAPSSQRSALVAEMQARGVAMPNSVLASGNTALVLVRGFLRPGIQKNDTFDVEVRIPSQSETTSLRDGYLLETRLKEMRVLDGRFHDGHVLGLAKGPVLVDPSAGSKGKSDHVLLGRGRILGGGVCLKSRSLGLVLKPEHQNVRNSARVAAAVNKRFNTLDKGIKTGVATAKTDEFIELVIHPRYKDNISRYVQVVRAIAVRESPAEQAERLVLLEKQLADPITASHAAMQLEAIGKAGIDVLLKGIQSKDAEVRFYAAESLAYLDRREAAEPLGQIAREYPAFRVFALAAMGAMQDAAAYDQLRNLLSVPSAETRYGAFRALWTMNNKDPLVLGEQLGGQFGYHVLDSQGPPMIHVTLKKRPEVVLFGHEQRLRSPVYLEAGGRIMIHESRTNPEEIVVSRFAVGEQDQQRVVSNRIDDVIRAVVELGGTYPDVVQALTQAKTRGALPGRFEVDALPEDGRTFDRVTSDESDQEPETATESTGLLSGNPLSKLFPKSGKKSSAPTGDAPAKSKEEGPNEADSDDGPRTE